MEQDPNRSLTAEHGAATQDKEKGERFLASHPLLTLFLLVLIVVLGQFWYQALFQMAKSITGEEEPSVWLLILFAAVVTLIFFILVQYIFKVPVVDLV